MSEYKKQHILPKTYIKYFSKNESGLGIVTLDMASQKKSAEYRNQGDKIFWSKYYYKDDRLLDSLAIEKFFGRCIEPTYNSLIQTIKLETEIADWDTKSQLLQWLIYSKLRSPAYRMNFEIKVNFLNKLNRVLPKESTILIDNILKDIEKYSKEYHLNHLVDDTVFKKTVENLVSGLMVKKWKILISHENTNFWTSDNPGFSIFLDDYETTKQILPSKFLENFTTSSVHFYPLTKNYCLECGPYMKDDSISLNLYSDSIKYQIINDTKCSLINTCTTLTACNFLILDESVMQY
jgi:hypothetical protein